MNYVRKFLQIVKLAPTDEQLGQQAAIHPAFGADRASIVGGRGSIAASRTNGGFPPFDPTSKLVEFRLLVGIMSDFSFQAPRGFDPTHRPMVTVGGRPAPNVGIYMTVVDKEVKCRKNYKHFSVAVNVCLGLQIIVAAAITALGAANSHNHAVVVFGAINTIIAGFLTYLKGSGMPNRLEYFQHEWDKVREYIEARERDLMCSDDAFDIYDQVEVIRQMYEQVKSDVESNTPDRFVSAGTSRPQPESSAIRPGLSGKIPSPSNGLEDVNGKLSRMTSSVSGYMGTGARKGAEVEVERVGSDAEKEALGFGQRTTAKSHDTSVHFLEQAGGLKARVEDKVKELGDLEKQIESHGRLILKQKETEVQTKAQEAESLRSGLLARSSKIVGDQTGEITKLQTEIDERLRSIEGLRASQLSESTQVAHSDSMGIAPDVIQTGDSTTS